MEYTLTEAAKATGKDRTTLFRAIQKGRLSARKAEGTYMIDAAELHRVYPLNVAQEGAREAAPIALQDRATASNDAQVEIARLQERVAGLEAQLAEARETIADLRASRDAAVEAVAVSQATARDIAAALSRQLPPPEAPAVTSPPPRGWKARLWGR